MLKRIWGGAAALYECLIWCCFYAQQILLWYIIQRARCRRHAMPWVLKIWWYMRYFTPSPLFAHYWCRWRLRIMILHFLLVRRAAPRALLKRARVCFLIFRRAACRFLPRAIATFFGISRRRRPAAPPPPYMLIYERYDILLLLPKRKRRKICACARAAICHMLLPCRRHFLFHMILWERKHDIWCFSLRVIFYLWRYIFRRYDIWYVTLIFWDIWKRRAPRKTKARAPSLHLLFSAAGWDIRYLWYEAKSAR